MSSSISNYIYGEISAFDGKYKHKAEQIIFLGWKIVENKEIILSNPNYSYLLGLKQNTIIEYKKIISTIHLKNNILHYTEARLVQLLEEMEIGRPSTFSSLVDKIQERQYVVKENIKGKQIQCKEFTLEGQELTETNVEKEFGNEKNKLVIQPLGIAVIEFLIKNFDTLFDYEYTKNMEKELDSIAIGKKSHIELCKTCYNEITCLTNKLDQHKYEIKIDETNSYIIGKNGPVIKETNIDTNAITFKSVKKDIDVKKLELGEYKLEDLLDHSSLKGKKMGNYQGNPLYLKKGKYGLYVEWGTNKKSLNEFGNRPIENIDYTDIIKILEKDNLLDINKPVGLVREINKHLSIRNGQYGHYIFYKNNKMKKPAFYKLNNFKGDCITCDKTVLYEWIKDTYHIE
jgi:DNA topoisomerase-1